MKYFIDTEFVEGTQKKLFGKTKPTIDLISIGIACEDGREYYAISKDFNLKEAWNRYDLKPNRQFPAGPEYNKVYWLRENVLMPILWDLIAKEREDSEKWERISGSKIAVNYTDFSYGRLKDLIKKYGKTKKEIAFDVFRFVHQPVIEKYDDKISFAEEIVESAYNQKEPDHEFYAYYSAYDWVAFCWIFGRMIDLPKGFPMYCRDLKQIMDQNGLSKAWKDKHCPDPIGEHNALVDAKWNLKLYKTITTTDLNII